MRPAEQWQCAASAPAAAQCCRAVTSASNVMQQGIGRGKAFQNKVCKPHLAREPCANRWGCWRGSCTASRKAVLASSMLPTCKSTASLLHAAACMSTLQGNLHSHEAARTQNQAPAVMALHLMLQLRGMNSAMSAHNPSARQQQLRLAVKAGCITAPCRHPSHTGVKPSQQLSLRVVQLVPTSEKPSPQSSGLTTSLSSFFSNVFSQCTLPRSASPAFSSMFSP